MTSAFDDHLDPAALAPEPAAPLYQTDPRDHDGEQYDLADRQALRRVAGLSTELEDVTEVEYRQLRLERVVLIGVWTEGSSQDAENSLAELAALAETAGSARARGPDPAPRQARTPRRTSAPARRASCATSSWPPAPTR